MQKKYLILLIASILLAFPWDQTAKKLHRRQRGTITHALEGNNKPLLTITQNDKTFSSSELTHKSAPNQPESSQDQNLIKTNDQEKLSADEQTNKTMPVVPDISQTDSNEKRVEEDESQEEVLSVKEEYQLPLEFQQVEKDESIKETLQAISPEPEATIELQFEDADLTVLVKQIEHIFDITFITEDTIKTDKAPTKKLEGNKISFKTHQPLTKKEVWNLFTTFLEIAGFTVVPEPTKNIYRIRVLDAARKAPVPTFIGVDYTTLPENDQVIRYLYFIENSTVDALKPIVEALRSTSSAAIYLQENKGLVLTDKAYNIKMLMKIIKELDKVTMPQAMSVLKLRQADVQQVKDLYDALIQASPDQKAPFRPFNVKKPSSLFFPENIQIIAEPRTNSLILLGSEDAIRKIEEFIIKHIDVDLDQPYSPLHIYQVKYADADTIATIMNEVTKFGQTTEAGKAGGVRGQDKFLQPLSFTAEKETNRIVVKGQYEDFLVAKEIMDQLDEQQPQVAIEVLILSVELRNNKELGAQIRSKVPGLDGFLGQNITWQTSGLKAGTSGMGIVQNPDNPGSLRLLGNLLNLVTQAGPGNTVLSLGRDIYNVWGVLQTLQTITNLQVVSNPFLVATNKTPATVSVGETRRVVTGTIIGAGNTTDTRGNEEAALTVKITPQINSDGMIVLELTVDLTEFINPTDFTSPDKTTKKVVTKTIVANKEVLALGGLIRNVINESLSKTPLLGDIPILGWLFKNKSKVQDKESLLILISTRIISPEATSDINQFTKERLADYQGTIDEMKDVSEKHDPIHKVFFAQENKTEKIIDDFIFERNRKSTKRANRRKRRKKQPDKQVEETKRDESQKDLPDEHSTYKTAVSVKPVESKSAPAKTPSSTGSFSKTFKEHHLPKKDSVTTVLPPEKPIEGVEA